MRPGLRKVPLEALPDEAWIRMRKVQRQTCGWTKVLCRGIRNKKVSS